ncbi:MAG: tetratricopeptide repeat protein [Chloroflexi bacterium]|nr:tetratricopeptide repeat protein [Chloroflexota bacterium]MCI0578046.1 tetratricopeptide repeat protein [Chloroflexota bacterium]
MNCPKCNYACPPDFAFCPKCGTTLQQSCQQCGFQAPLDFAFCPKCGSRLGSAPPPPPPPPPPADPLAERLKRLVPQAYADKLLTSHGRVEAERRVVTILFSDVKGSTAMAETMDPEEVMEIMDDVFDVLIEPIYRHEGTLARLMGDAILAFFGAPVAHEDDPIRACRAALDILAGAKGFAARLERQRGISGFNVRVGINTGLVVVGEVGTDMRVEYTAMGDAINLAARMEQAAPAGGILISHNTYRYVQGGFDLQPLEPVMVKGKSQPVQVYLVQREKPRTFQAPGRGIEGLGTPLIGRQAELAFLQEAYQAAAEQGQRQVITLVAEAGVGKSRLLREFDAWLAQRPGRPERFVGRAEPDMQNLPYALIRDLCTFRCHIQAGDQPALARQKLEACLGQVFSRRAADEATARMQAHFIGQLLGLDFSDSPYLQGVVDDARQLYDRALIYLVEYFKTVAAAAPAVILLEDIHWADDSSLDVLNQLALATPAQRLLVLCAARPSLFERRPDWGVEQSIYQQLRLRRLSPEDSQRLVLEILRQVDQVPDKLRDLIVKGAEGNPFYVEELIKMLLEDGVIVKGEEQWQVAMERLAEIRVPPTLTGVLQARLDALPPAERETLQRASVVGRVFWDEAVAYLSPGDPAPADALPGMDSARQRLAALQSREIVFDQAEAGLAGARAYTFKHAILRDVTYESVLKRLRRVYHGQVAEWLRRRAGERADEYAGQMGDHLELAGEAAEAAVYLRRAGERAARQFANAEAIAYFSRALKLAPAGDQEASYDLLLSREKVYDVRGERQAQAQDLADLAALADALDGGRRAEVALRLANYADVTGDYAATIAAARQAVGLGQASGDDYNQAVGHWFWGRALWRQGEYEPAQIHLEQALALAHQGGYGRVEADSLRNLGGLARHQGKYTEAAAYNEQALYLYRAVEDRPGESATLQNLGIIARNQGDYPAARRYYEQAMRLSQVIGNRLDESDVLTNLGVATMYQGDYGGARAYFEQSRRIKQEIGDRHGEGMVLGNLGIVARNQGDLAAARAYFEQAVGRYRELGYQQPESLALANLGLLFHYLGDDETAMATCYQAVQISQAIGARHVEAEALNYLGHAQLSLGQAGEATVSYQAALKIRRELDQPNMATEPLAGLAAVALASLAPAQALAHVEEILAYLANNTLDGVDEPYRVYLTCYRALAAANDGRAGEILQAAHRLLQEQAVRISDATLRQAFLDGVAIHRAIVQAYSTTSINSYHS